MKLRMWRNRFKDKNPPFFDKLFDTCQATGCGSFYCRIDMQVETGRELLAVRNIFVQKTRLKFLRKWELFSYSRALPSKNLPSLNLIK